MRTIPGILISVLSVARIVREGRAGNNAPFHDVIHPPKNNVELTVTVFVDDGGTLRYKVDAQDQQIISPSSLGLLLSGGVRIGSDVTIEKKTDHKDVKESYRKMGTHPVAQSHYVEVTYTVFHIPTEFTYLVDFRVHDAPSPGISFRYRMLGNESLVIQDDMSEFRMDFAPTDRAWTYEREDGRPMLELKTDTGPFKKVRPSMLALRQRGNKARYGLPMVIEDSSWSVPYPYRAIHEAALFDWEGFHIVALPDAKGFRTELARVAHPGAPPLLKMSLPLTTSWRVVQIARNLNQLVNSDLISDLSPPPEVRNPGLFAFLKTSGELPDLPGYIKPGRSAWSWWGKRGAKVLGPAGEIQYLEAASKLGFEYTTIDDGWEKWPDAWETVKNLTGYAKTKGVGVFLWKHRIQIDDPTDDYKQLQDFLDRVKQAGAVGIKVDFFESEWYNGIRLQEAVNREAAKRELMTNLHGIQKPTGESRTYPNEITREAIFGLEVNKLWPNIKLKPVHNAALSFTRFSSGPGDYTPLALRRERRGKTTEVHQVATLVTFTSPLQTIAENISVIRSKSYRDVIAAIPTTWDETRALPPSAIGSLTVLARRKGDTWYIGIVSGVAQTRNIKSIPLDFLDSNKIYTGTFLYTHSMSDNEQDDKVAVKRVRRMKCTRLTNVRLWGEGIRADGMVLIMKQMGKRAAV
ncbi:unnamed protein product [Vitrella brassicaformis CCMP3155]|uniref:Alpha-galactosidase n=1 Tax=Vitrella brassicaformis (strain CCMP3155) TaxID=1169540 RepID=A0A0G4H7N7_VITBC|nr:unnamed protein product [Vitrella brassicaformis CCMP3155]|eukprot:CEM39880.1 unnamed protein product [Vitrella brassicaformis CCMP3155]